MRVIHFFGLFLGIGDRLELCLEGLGGMSEGINILCSGTQYMRFLDELEVPPLENPSKIV